MRKVQFETFGQLLGMLVREGDQDGGPFPMTCQPWDRALYAEHHRESQRSMEGERYQLCPPNRKPQFPSLYDSLGPHVCREVC